MDILPKVTNYCMRIFVTCSPNPHSAHYIHIAQGLEKTSLPVFVYIFRIVSVSDNSRPCPDICDLLVIRYCKYYTSITQYYFPNQVLFHGTGSILAL